MPPLLIIRALSLRDNGPLVPLVVMSSIAPYNRHCLDIVTTLDDNMASGCGVAACPDPSPASLRASLNPMGKCAYWGPGRIPIAGLIMRHRNTHRPKDSVRLSPQFKTGALPLQNSSQFC
jgi:hypothetical protein